MTARSDKALGPYVMAILISFGLQVALYFVGSSTLPIIWALHAGYFVLVVAAIVNCGMRANWLWFLAPLGLPASLWVALIILACALQRGCI